MRINRYIFLLLTVFACSKPLSLWTSPSPSITSGFQVELANPSYTSNGIETQTGGVVTSANFKLQARYIRQYSDKGKSWIEASGELMFFYRGKLLVGDHILYNLTDNYGVLEKGSLGIGSWFISCKRVYFYNDHSLKLDEAEVSTDSSKLSSWSISAASVIMDKNNTFIFNHVCFRLMRIPIFYFPVWNSTKDSLFNQPIEYDMVLKGSRKRKVGFRYRFYSSDNAELWSKFEYYIGRGPGLSLDGKFHFDMATFKASNFAARNSTVANPSLDYRYRFKGHYHRHLSQSSTFNIYYDKYSDSNIQKDYNFKAFDREEAGQTKVVLRDAKPSLIHQITERIKFNNFQTVKRELPSYFATLHPLHAPRIWDWSHFFIVSSHFRAEYLSYDFQDRSPLNNYHSTRFLGEGAVSRPFNAGGFQLTPSVGYKLAAYNNCSRGVSQGIVAPTGELHAETKWLSLKNSHLITAFSTLSAMAKPQSSVDEHYIFDYRDAIVGYSKCTTGVKQEWFDLTGIRASILMQWQALFGRNASGQSHHFYTFEGSCLVTPTWRIVAATRFSDRSQKALSYSGRLENTWSAKIATILEFRQRNSTSWKKSYHDDFGLEKIRSYHELINSDLSDPHKTLLTHTNFQITPNWILRFDTAHGFDRGVKNGSRVPLYRQYCLGIGTDLGANWRLQVQIGRNPQGWDSHFRLELSDGPIRAPAPRF